MLNSICDTMLALSGGRKGGKRWNVRGGDASERQRDGGRERHMQRGKDSVETRARGKDSRKRAVDTRNAETTRESRRYSPPKKQTAKKEKKVIEWGRK